MKQRAISGWLHRLLACDGPHEGAHDLSARAQRARQDAQRWLQARQEEHARQLLTRLQRSPADTD